MSISRHIRRFVRVTTAPIVLLSVTAFFGWNVTQGEHGIYAYEKQLPLLKQAQQAYQNALIERDFWRRRVAALNEQSLDVDVLDERARAMLNMADKDDIIVPYNWYKPPAF